MRCPNCSAQISDSDVICLECGCETVSGRPMRWHLFLVHLGLWIAGLVCIALGVGNMVGVQYLIQGMPPGAVYDVFPALTYIDFVYGLLLVGVGILFFLCRARLRSFKKRAPLLLNLAYAALIVLAAVYSVVSSTVVGTPASRLVGVNEIASVVGMAVGVSLNAAYYKKRDFLFEP